MKNILFISLCFSLAFVLGSCTSTKSASSASPGIKWTAPINLTNPKVIKAFEDPETKRIYKFVRIGDGIVVIEQFETSFKSNDASKMFVASTNNVLAPQKPIPNIIYTKEVCFLRFDDYDYFSVIHEPESGNVVCLDLSLPQARASSK